MRVINQINFRCGIRSKWMSILLWRNRLIAVILHWLHFGSFQESICCNIIAIELFKHRPIIDNYLMDSAQLKCWIIGRIVDRRLNADSPNCNVCLSMKNLMAARWSPFGGLVARIVMHSKAKLCDWNAPNESFSFQSRHSLKPNGQRCQWMHWRICKCMLNNAQRIDRKNKDTTRARTWIGLARILLIKQMGIFTSAIYYHWLKWQIAANLQDTGYAAMTADQQGSECSTQSKEINVN